MNEFYQTVLDVLRQDRRFFSQEGELLRNAVYEAAMAMDPELLRLLRASPAVRARFFTAVDGVEVFDKVGFGWVISNRQFLPDSFTRFTSRIGLVDRQEQFLADSPDVCLAFPYKDCVLEGGQTREDQRREEIFYNERLAPDQVDRLLAPKAFSGAVRYTAAGEEQALTLEEGDNLVIQGNNLLAARSLLERFRGKVKLIYLDPPYNTGSDSFGYNDRFSRSSWLVFLKNRLETARELLAPEGAIYVQLDYNHVHYAKVLMDEIFGEENFQREIIWRIGWVSGYKTAANNYIRNHDTILFYSRDPNRLDFRKQYLDNSQFVPRLKDGKKWARAFQEAGVAPERARELVEEINHTSRPQRYPIEDVWNGSEYDDLNSIAIVSYSGETVSKMLGVPEVKGQKSEKLLQRIIQAHTAPGELVMDLFAGTGTTAAAAHKMGRRYIVMEQMDYVRTTTVERLKKVIGGEQSGISRAENWKGGGSFVFCQLHRRNAALAVEIQGAGAREELEALWAQMRESGLISCLADPEEFSPDDPDWAALTLEEQKRALLALLDKNQLYVSRWDLEDGEAGLTAADRAFTRSVYGEG